MELPFPDWDEDEDCMVGKKIGLFDNMASYEMAEVKSVDNWYTLKFDKRSAHVSNSL